VDSVWCGMLDLRCKSLEFIDNRLKAIFAFKPCATRLNSLSVYSF